MNKTLYVNDKDREIWKEAQALVRRNTADGSLSKFITEYLRDVLIPQLKGDTK